MPNYVTHALVSQVNQSARKAAVQSAGSRLAQVLALNPAGGYDLQFSDGQGVSNIHSQPLTKWKVGQWVTVNRVGSLWIIVGAAGATAGSHT